MAPNGYYTSGATVCTADGQPHIFHGVDRPSLEWSSTGNQISPSDFAAMATWHANVVRIALNQDWWVAPGPGQTAPLYDPTYPSTVDQAIAWAEQAGLDVILDLHWSDRGNLNVTKGNSPDVVGTSNQQPMADVNSVTFWSQVAARYKGDGHVLFELYNEPNSIGWNVWLSGGTVMEYQAVGMQTLYNAVRAAGADNVVIAGGIDWAYDLSGVRTHMISGYNIMYATHPYREGGSGVGQWNAAFGYLASEDIAPVIVTEFGDNRVSGCTAQWDTSVIQFAANPSLHISWTAWAWYYPGDSKLCSFPALLAGWDYAPTVQGAVVQMALMNDPAPMPPSAADAGSDAEAGIVEAGATDAGASDAVIDAGAFDATGSEAGDGGGGGVAPDDAGPVAADEAGAIAAPADAGAIDASLTDVDGAAADGAGE
jgi:aryl-phospho-beta-D-glucosidase BglC (GH1 family)